MSTSSRKKKANKTPFVLMPEEQRKLYHIYEPSARDLARIAGCTLRSLSVDEGDDAVQEAFMIFAYRASRGELRCLDNRRIIDIPDDELDSYVARCRIYLKHIVVCKCCEFHRRAKLRPKTDWRSLAAAMVDDDPAKGLCADECIANLYKAVSELSSVFHKVVYLRHFGHCTEKEIAQILDIPCGTVKSRLHRAYRLLQSYIERTNSEKILTAIHSQRSFHVLP